MNFAKALTTVLVLLCLLPAGAAAYPGKAGGLVGGDASIRLDAQLRKAMEGEGIRAVALKPGREKGRAILLPNKEGAFEPHFGSGYVFLGGGFRLQAKGGSVAIRRLVLNTAKKRLAGVVAGRAITLAALDEVKGRRTDLGIVVKVGSMRLTERAAAIIGPRLGSPDVFRAHRLLGTAVVSGPFFTVPVTSGTIGFSFDEGFRQKLDSLGVSVSVYEAGTQTGSAPLAFSFPEVRGEIDPEFEHGRVFATNDGVRFTQAGATPPRDLIWRGIGVNFENGFGGVGSDVAVASGMAIGQIEFGTTPTFNPRTGVFTGPPTAATLSPFAVGPLNDAFGGGKAVFTAGEPLGSFSFTAGVR